ncbi:hypothetical protein CDL12_07424 [Handroanthus impetiginosus]|uniref:Uncharacterized protein n=1 Tax=Handroanthus impetiginosus TaxID=429701 RepID=A0A2G9HR33_9LAMI|nr:hypothetical protein CDL12_07424 [Handroanthus impetiginosus]
MAKWLNFSTVFEISAEREPKRPTRADLQLIWPLEFVALLEGKKKIMDAVITSKQTKMEEVEVGDGIDLSMDLGFLVWK